jgi:hypothetical protein
MRFSEKYGYAEPRQSIQVEELDKTTRKRLWNVVWRNRGNLTIRFGSLAEDMWDEYFGEPMDNMSDVSEEVRRVFMEGEWYSILDTIEYISENKPDTDIESKFNEVLEEEKSAYRLVEGEVAPITDEIELEAIEDGMEKTRKYEGVREHLEQALVHFSDEDNPDYRNSVKESISAAESMAQIVIGDEDATLGQALSKMDQEHGLNGALKSSFSSLYGYASDQEGIRHALSEKSDVSFAFAKFMLVNCHAFVNYLIDEYEAD